MQKPEVQTIDVVQVYPKRRALYHGAKWAVVSYALTNGTKGVFDFPIPKAASDVVEAAKKALANEIARGVYNFQQPNYQIQAA